MAFYTDLLKHGQKWQKKRQKSLIIDQKMSKKYKKLFLFELIRQFSSI